MKPGEVPEHLRALLSRQLVVTRRLIAMNADGREVVAVAPRARAYLFMVSAREMLIDALWIGRSDGSTWGAVFVGGAPLRGLCAESVPASWPKVDGEAGCPIEVLNPAIGPMGGAKEGGSRWPIHGLTNGIKLRAGETLWCCASNVTRKSRELVILVAGATVEERQRNE